MSFYLTLPSNASMNIFPNNTQANYTTLLARSIDLNDRFEVGLAEISYINSYTVDIGTITITQDIHHEDVFKAKFGTQTIKLTLDDCLSFQQFIIIINNEITNVFREFYKTNSKNENFDNFDRDRDNFMPVFKPFTQPFCYFMVQIPTNTSIVFDGAVAELLKLNKKEFESLNELHLCDNFLVYTDIINDQLYGDVSAKIIRNVVPSGSHGDKVSITFNTIHYVDLKISTLKTININIRDSQGELIHFDDKLGKVVVKLHFRLK